MSQVKVPTSAVPTEQELQAYGSTVYTVTIVIRFGVCHVSLTEASSPPSWTFYAMRRSWARITPSSSWLSPGGDSR
jgi:hypothetical protein